MKGLGLMLLLGAAVAAGFAASGTLTGRAARIRLERQFLQAMCSTLRSKLPPVSELLCDLAGQAAFEPLGFLQEAAARSAAFPDCWVQAVRHDRALAASEREVLLTAGEILGSMPLAEQLSALSLCSERLAALQADAERCAHEKGGLCRSMGVFGGLFFVILLL